MMAGRVLRFRFGIEEGKTVNFEPGYRNHRSNRTDLKRMSIQTHRILNRSDPTVGSRVIGNQNSRISVEKGEMVDFELGCRNHWSNRTDLKRMLIQAQRTSNRSDPTVGSRDISNPNSTSPESTERGAKWSSSVSGHRDHQSDYTGLKVISIQE